MKNVYVVKTLKKIVIMITKTVIVIIMIIKTPFRRTEKQLLRCVL